MDSQYTKSCLSTNIPKVDEALEDCTGFILTKCVQEGEKTQEDINTTFSSQIASLTNAIASIQNTINTNMSTNNIIQVVDLGEVITPENSINNLSPFIINRNQIFIFTGTNSGEDYKWIFKKGKGSYGVGGTQVTTNDLQEI